MYSKILIRQMCLRICIKMLNLIGILLYYALCNVHWQSRMFLPGWACWLVLPNAVLVLT